jgi:lipoprotein-anchoring transpeptidase ErfK/SrfK
MSRTEQSALIAQSAQTLGRIMQQIPARYVAVSVALQELLLVNDGTVENSYAVSTSRFGTGNTEGSLQTPTGVHRIAEKFGFKAPLRCIFRDRIDSGETWRPEMGHDNFVLTRIMWLQGLESGLNCGAGIDSFDRYIYIHGTANEASLGKPLSHGCVCMGNQEVTELFEFVGEGTIVVINK